MQPSSHQVLCLGHDLASLNSMSVAAHTLGYFVQASVSRSANPGAALHAASPAQCLPQMLHMSPHSAAASSAMRSGQPPQHVTIAAASAALRNRDQTASSASAQHFHNQDSAQLGCVISEQSASHMMTTYASAALAHEQPPQSQLPVITQSSLSNLSQHAKAPAESDIQQSVIQPPNRSRRMTRSAARASLASSASGDLSQQTSRSHGTGRQQHADSKSQLSTITENAESSLCEINAAQQLCNVETCQSDSQSQPATNPDGNPEPNAACHADTKKPAVRSAAESSAPSGGLERLSSTSQAAQASVSKCTTDAPEGSGDVADRSNNIEPEHHVDALKAPIARLPQAQDGSVKQDGRDAAQLDTTQQQTGETFTQQAADVSTQLPALHQPTAQPTQASAQLQQGGSNCDVEGASSALDAKVAEAASHRPNKAASLQEPRGKGKKRRARRPPKSKQPSKCPVEFIAPNPAAAAQDIGLAIVAASNDQPALHSPALPASSVEQDPGAGQEHSSKHVSEGCADPAGDVATVQVNPSAPVLRGEDVYAIPCVL